MESNLNPEINQSGFDEFDKEVSFVDAEKWARFINHIIDEIIIYALCLAFIFFTEIISEIFSLGLLENIDVESSSFEYMMYLLFIIVMILYYSVFEFTTGRTIGKLITKTKVIDDDTNVKPTFTIALIRSLCRFIPLDSISFFFYDAGGWHDRISKTRVVKK